VVIEGWKSPEWGRFDACRRRRSSWLMREKCIVTLCIF